MKPRHALAALVIASGCASEPTYIDHINAIVVPTDDANRQKFCSWVRSEIARQQSMPVSMASPQMRPYFEVTKGQNVAALEQKASEAQCGAAFLTAPAAKPLNECFNLCKKATGRTDAECFDQCNK